MASLRQVRQIRCTSFADVLRIPGSEYLHGQGVSLLFQNELSLAPIGLKATDLPWFAFEKADVVICVGYDMVNITRRCGTRGDKIIVHIDALPAEVTKINRRRWRPRRHRLDVARDCVKARPQRVANL
jgi:acetolactate synthase-1/2/3 large subunit